MKKTVVFILLLTYVSANAQMLTPEAFIDQVRKNHPVAKQAAIQIEKAKADFKTAKSILKKN